MIKGIATYISVFGLITIWTLGWVCICWLVGSSLNLKMSTSALVGALLGPLGLIAVIVIGLIERSKPTYVNRVYSHNDERVTNPFT